MPEALERIARCARLLPDDVSRPGRRRRRHGQRPRELYDAGATLLVAGHGDLRPRRPPARLPAAGTSTRVSRSSARSSSPSAGAARRIRTRSSAPCSSATARSSARAGTSDAAGRTRRSIALEQAGERARGATLYVTLEPCTHHGRTPPCADAIVAAGVARVVVGVARPEPGRRRQRRRAAARRGHRRRGGRGRASRRARGRTRRGGRGRRSARPFVTYKVAVTLDGRVDGAGRALDLRRGVAPARARAARRVGRRRRRHGNRARRRAAARRARRRRDAPAAAARVRARPAARTAPSSSCARGPLEDELRALAAEGVQSLLLEGGPTLATAFLAAGLVDKLLVFVAPTLAGGGPRFVERARRRDPALTPPGDAGRPGRPARGIRSRQMTERRLSPPFRRSPQGVALRYTNPAAQGRHCLYRAARNRLRGTRRAAALACPHVHGHRAGAGTGRRRRAERRRAPPAGRRARDGVRCRRRRLGRDRRRLPHRGRGRRRAARVRRRPGDAEPHGARRGSSRAPR